MTDATEGYARVGGRVGETLPSRSCSRRWTDRRRDWALSRRRVPAKRVSRRRRGAGNRNSRRIVVRPQRRGPNTMSWFISAFIKLGLLKEDLDYHLIRASMVVLFLFFGYQKWFEYEAQVLVPYISNGPLISWMYPVFGVRARAGLSACRSGRSRCSCSWDSGTSDWESSAPSVPARPSSEPSRSSRSCRTAGRHLPAGFRPWRATCRSS